MKLRVTFLNETRIWDLVHGDDSYQQSYKHSDHAGIQGTAFVSLSNFVLKYEETSNRHFNADDAYDGGIVTCFQRVLPENYLSLIVSRDVIVALAPDCTTHILRAVRQFPVH
jgi:hypothetical protein